MPTVSWYMSAYTRIFGYFCLYNRCTCMCISLDFLSFLPPLLTFSVQSQPLPNYTPVCPKIFDKKKIHMALVYFYILFSLFVIPLEYNLFYSINIRDVKCRESFFYFDIIKFHYDIKYTCCMFFFFFNIPETRALRRLSCFS